MTIQEWLKDVYYDEYGQYLWSKQSSDGGSQLIGEVRGWGAIQNLPITSPDKFQDEVGKFIAEAINEKVQRLNNKTNEHRRT
jgi:hypothetical protein